MFPVEIRIAEDALTARMALMREWLDHQRFEPAVFRYTFTSPGILFRVEFTLEVQAEAFAKAFDGQVQ